MEAKVKRNGEVFVIHMRGKVLADAVEVFHQVLKKQMVKEKFVLEMSQLHFVGSNGISHLLDTLCELAKIQCRPLKMYNVPSEFLKIFTANIKESFFVYSDEEMAMKSFYENVHPIAPVTSSPDGVETDELDDITEETDAFVLNEGTVTVEVLDEVLLDPYKDDKGPEGTVSSTPAAELSRMREEETKV